VPEVGGVDDRLWAGRSHAVASLFRTHHRRLVGLASLLCDDQATAEDVVQEAFAGLYRRWWHLRDPRNAVAYLNRAVVNGSRLTDHARPMMDGRPHQACRLIAVLRSVERHPRLI
jgi:predicted RNA polymerase sigma factor